MESRMDWLKQLAQYAGPVALAAFAGVFLGGIALSFFWKNFGPWKLLEECKKECANCAQERKDDALKMARVEAQMADLQARHDVILEACQAAGLGLRIGPLQDPKATTMAPVSLLLSRKDM